MGNTGPVDCALCGDRNARSILLMHSYSCVCTDKECPNFCPDQKRLVEERIAKLFESDDELDFLAGPNIVIPANLFVD